MRSAFFAILSGNRVSETDDSGERWIVIITSPFFFGRGEHLGSGTDIIEKGRPISLLDSLSRQFCRFPVEQVLQMIEGYFGGELSHQGGEQRHGGIVPHGHHHLVEQHNHRLLFREAADAVLGCLLQRDECADGHLLLLLNIVLAVPRHAEAYPPAIDAAKARAVTDDEVGPLMFHPEFCLCRFTHARGAEEHHAVAVFLYQRGVQGHPVPHRHACLAGGADGRGNGNAGRQPSLYSFLIVGLSGDVKRHLAIVLAARQHILAITLHSVLVHQRDECPCVFRVVEVKPLGGTKAF